MKRIKTLLLLLVLYVPTALLAAQPYDRLYVFGDSLSDTGNLASIAGDFPDPPYYQNRVTNGLVAVEVMAARLGLPLTTSLHMIGPAVGNNYAVVAASAARNEAIDLNTQVALFLANHAGVAPDKALYVMFIGGNDIRKARDTADWTAAVQKVEEAADTIATQMQVLAASGARHWLVVNGPDIGIIPETGLIAAATGLSEFPARASALSILFNDALKRRMQVLEDEAAIEVERFDLFRLFARIIEKSDKLGFTNAVEPCFSSQLGQYTEGCAFGFNIDKYVFFDEIHPTARVHAMIGEAMYRKVSDEDHRHGHKGGHKDKDEHEDKKEVESATE